MNFRKILGHAILLLMSFNSYGENLKPFMGVEFQPWNKHTFYSDTTAIYTDTLNRYELAGVFFVGVKFHV